MKQCCLRMGVVVLWLVVVLAGSAAAQQPTRPAPGMETFGRDGHMYIGADYYPEHWPKDRWQTDVRLMREAGFNIVRMAEFSWAFIEPQEGVYDFAWLDSALALLDQNGINAILGTPTASMPGGRGPTSPAGSAARRHSTRWRRRAPAACWSWHAPWWRG